MRFDMPVGAPMDRWIGESEAPLQSFALLPPGHHFLKADVVLPERFADRAGPFADQTGGDGPRQAEKVLNSCSSALRRVRSLECRAGAAKPPREAHRRWFRASPFAFRAAEPVGDRSAVRQRAKGAGHGRGRWRGQRVTGCGDTDRRARYRDNRSLSRRAGPSRGKQFLRAGTRHLSPRRQMPATTAPPKMCLATSRVRCFPPMQ